MDISVVIVSWNTRELTLQCLDSLADTGGLQTEIIVVDNASHDGSPDSIETLFPKVRIIRNPCNLGFSGANNIGIRQSMGDYICLVNSDVVVLRGCLSNMYHYMEAHPGIGLLGPKILWPDARTVQRSCMGYPTIWNMLCRALGMDALFPQLKIFGGFLMPHWRHNNVREVDVINGCFWMVRRSAMNVVGLLDENFFMYAEDIDWCKRFKDQGWRVVFYPGAEAIHYGGASSAAMPARFYVAKQYANYQYWKKHHSRRSTGLYFLILLLHEGMRVLLYSFLYRTQKDSIRLNLRHKARRSIDCVRLLMRMRFRPDAKLSHQDA